MIDLRVAKIPPCAYPIKSDKADEPVRIVPGPTGGIGFPIALVQ
jgi:hypothetical protein